MKIPPLVKDVSVWLSITSLGLLVGATVFQTLVIVSEYSRDIPKGMIDFANSPVEPSKYWTAPVILVSYLCPFLALAFNWKTPRQKWLLMAGILFFFVVGVTDLYFIPRLTLMGLTTNSQPAADLALLAATVKEWVFADQLRFWILIIPSFFLTLKAATTPLSATKAE